MKKINCKSVEIPWYLKFFTVIRYESHSVKIGIDVPFKYLFYKIWFAFPRWLYDYQMQNCKNYIPDFYDPKKHKEATGDKVKPFLGFVIRIPSGKFCSLNWFKYLEKI